jgi:Ca2+-binding EF-hand superfamily protein
MISIMLGHIDKGDLTKLKLAFEEMDTDHDGFIRTEELENAGNHLGGSSFKYKWHQVIKRLDFTGDGGIDYQEFITAAVDHKTFITDELIESTFHMFDTDNDGVL